MSSLFNFGLDYYMKFRMKKEVLFFEGLVAMKVQDDRMGGQNGEIERGKSRVFMYAVEKKDVANTTGFSLRDVFGQKFL